MTATSEVAQSLVSQRLCGFLCRSCGRYAAYNRRDVALAPNGSFGPLFLRHLPRAAPAGAGLQEWKARRAKAR